MTIQPAQVKAIFDQAVELELPEKRAAFLDEACGGDAELRAKVQWLVDAFGAAGSFLESPPPGLRPGPDKPDEVQKWQAERAKYPTAAPAASDNK